MDDCVIGNGGDFFYQGAYVMLEELLGPGAVKQIPLTHEVFTFLEGITCSGKASVYCQPMFAYAAMTS